MGLTGQVVSPLIERAPCDVELIAVGRPQFEVSHRDAVLSTLRSTRCDMIVNAAAYAAVDKAENEPDVAMRFNGERAGYVGEAAAKRGVPLVHLSIDYVLHRNLDRPYMEGDPTGPTGAYDRSKLAGEQKIAAACANAAILRTTWVYSPFGANFVGTMPWLGETRPEVLAEQIGNPTSALYIAAAVSGVARRMTAETGEHPRGVSHMTCADEATWAYFPERIFTEAARAGRPTISVRRGTTSNYTTPAARPANSRLDNANFRAAFGFGLPNWRASVDACVDRLTG